MCGQTVSCWSMYYVYSTVQDSYAMTCSGVILYCILTEALQTITTCSWCVLPLDPCHSSQQVQDRNGWMVVVIHKGNYNVLVNGCINNYSTSNFDAPSTARIKLYNSQVLISTIKVLLNHFGSFCETVLTFSKL